MLKKVKQSLQSIPGWTAKKYLLAISGGIDSMVLAHLFKKLELDFELAHCNFKLRGQESDADQNFIISFAKENGLKLHLNVCDLSNSKQNTQIAARNARYQWFQQLMQQSPFDYLVTAHHLDDSIETFFINLQRGTGLKGLLGITDQKNVLRPLKQISRQEITEYAKRHQISWREDSSNASDKYRRNYIRHHIIPEFTKTNPAFYQNFNKTFLYLKQSQDVIDLWFNNEHNKIVKKNNQNFLVDLKQLKQSAAPELFLYHWLSPYGFTDFKAVKALINNQSGKTIYSPTHRLIKNRDTLVLSEKSSTFKNNFYKMDYNQSVKIANLEFEPRLIDAQNITEKTYFEAEKNEAFIDYDLLQMPLTVRKWQTGDYFYPLGLNGKKKLSDFFINQKISLSEKEKIWLFCNGKDIVWISGFRIDNRYKITDQTKRILHIKMTEKK